MHEKWRNDETVLPAAMAAVRQNWQDHAVACLGIVWHPDPSRIGMIAPLSFGNGNCFSISRFEPVFRGVYDRNACPLEDQHVSRQPLTVRRVDDRAFEITPPGSRMSVSVNGRPIDASVTVSLDALGADILISLSDTVILAIFEALLPLHLEAADHGLIGVSRTIQAAWQSIRQAAPTDLPVLINGATGTGKELVASAIHALSARSGQKLHALNMATLSPSLAQAELFGAAAGAYTGATRERTGLFPLADGATLFLDEIGDTPESVQPMLLRALESGEYRRLGDTGSHTADVRVISATDRSLDDATFSQPLRRRLEGVVIRLAPLRERRVDIGLLLRHFLTREEAHIDAFDPRTLSARQIMALLLHPWPGNMRELMGVARQIRLGAPVKLAGDRGPAATPPAVHAAGMPPETSRRDPGGVSDTEMIDALDKAGWNVKAAADLLNVSRTSLYRLMDRSDSVRDADDIPDDLIADVMRRYPGDIDAWAQRLQIPRDALKRRIRRVRQDG